MEMVRVISSAISAIGYDPETMRMCIMFKDGKAYDYCRVPGHVFESFMRSISKGTYYQDHIRDRYQC